MNLRHFAEEFQRSVALFELLECGGGPPSVGVFGGEFIYYRIISARDGALNIYHFGCSLEAIKRQLPTCPSLAKKVNAITIRDALKQFEKYFPHCDNVRNAIAHAGELFNNPNSMKKHQQRTGHAGHGFSVSEGGLFTCALYERTYSVGIEGSVFSLTLDQVSLNKLLHIIQMIDTAFN